MDSTSKSHRDDTITQQLILHYKTNYKKVALDFKYHAI